MKKLLEKSIKAQLFKSPELDIESLFYAEPQTNYCQICLDVADRLHQLKASPRQWQPWFALAALSCFVQNNYRMMRITALIARVYDDLKEMMPDCLPEQPNRPDDWTLAYLLGLLPTDTTSELSYPMYQFMQQEEYSFTKNDCYHALGDVVKLEKWKDCTSLLNLLINDEPYRTGPTYESVLTAIVAVACKLGYSTEELSFLAKSRLWPVVESEDNIRPDYWLNSL